MQRESAFASATVTLLSWAATAYATEQVTVTATRSTEPIDRIPAAVDVVGGEEVQLARQQIGLDESLVRVPGLFMQDRYNFAQDLRISIRGFGARANFGIRGVRIFVDGIPETLPDGQGQVDSVDLGSAGRITVLRGGASSLYGNASGGVVLIDSEEPPGTAAVEARLSFGELGFAKQQLKFAGRAARLGYMANFADFKLDGFRDHSLAKGRSVNSKLSYAIDDSASLKLAVNYTDQPRSDDPGALTLAQATANPRQAAASAINFDAGEDLKQTRIGLVYDKSFGPGQSLTVRNYYVWRTFANLLGFLPGGAVTIDRFFTGGGLEYTNRGRLAGRDNRLIAGLDLDAQDDDRKRYDNNFGVPGALGLDQDEIVRNTGVFVQDALSLGTKLDLTLGVRHDRVRFKVDDRFLSDGDDSADRTLTRTSPMAALLYTATRSLNLYANVSTSFETPTTAELANPSGNGGFNSHLDPQSTINYELGMKASAGPRSRYTAAVFVIEVKDELVPFELASSPGRSFYRNAGKSRRKGFELGYASTPVKGLNFSLAYTYADYVFREFTDGAGSDFRGKTLPGQPDNLLHAEASYRYPFGLFVSCDALYVDRLFLDNANTAIDGPYMLANLRAGYARERGAWQWSLFAGANNLFDESYNSNTRINAAGGRYFEPGPKRNLYTGVELKWVY